MMLSLDTAYRSFGGEVEASSTPTICRLSDSRRHQLSAIARSLVNNTSTANSDLLSAAGSARSRNRSPARYPTEHDHPLPSCRSPLTLGVTIKVRANKIESSS